MKIFSCILLLSACVFLFSCKKASNSNEEQSNFIELIQNSSFEMNGNPAMQGWLADDTALCQLINDVPPGGGNWSMKIYAEWTFQHSARTTVAPLEGTHPFEFSVYGKIVRFHGSAILYLKHADTLTLRKSVTITDTTWTRYSFLDTISITRPDSLVVVLEGGLTNLVVGYTIFDLCSLKQK
jgi:hypothetical protein